MKAMSSRPLPARPLALPNLLTYGRIAAVPVVVGLLFWESIFDGPLWLRWVALFFFIAAGVTDYFDGYFARLWGQYSSLGKMLDPIADKLLICAAFISLVDMHLAPAWMVVIIIGRELMILGLRNIASAEGFTIAASTLGKTKMVLQVCAAAVLIAGARRPSLNWIGLALLWLVVISALVSAGQYFYRFWSQLDDRIKQRRKLRMMEAQKKPPDAVPL